MADEPPKKRYTGGPGRGHKINPNTGVDGRGTGRGSGQWGGPAKGASSTAGRVADENHFPSMPPEQRAAIMETKAVNRETMIGIYEEVAQDGAQSGMTRITAADKWLDRHEGKPMQRVETTRRRDRTDFSDSELEAIIQAGEDAGYVRAEPDKTIN